MSVLKRYNTITSQWETVVDGIYTASGSGDYFLSDDGSYKRIDGSVVTLSTPASANIESTNITDAILELNTDIENISTTTSSLVLTTTSVTASIQNLSASATDHNSRLNSVEASASYLLSSAATANHSHNNISILNNITSGGLATQFLSGDGTYRNVGVDNLILNSSSFNNILSPAASSVQLAFDVLDDHKHDSEYVSISATAINIGNGSYAGQGAVAIGTNQTALIPNQTAINGLNLISQSTTGIAIDGYYLISPNRLQDLYLTSAQPTIFTTINGTIETNAVFDGFTTGGSARIKITGNPTYDGVVAFEVCNSLSDIYNSVINIGDGLGNGSTIDIRMACVTKTVDNKYNVFSYTVNYPYTTTSDATTCVLHDQTTFTSHLASSTIYQESNYDAGNGIITLIDKYEGDPEVSVSFNVSGSYITGKLNANGRLISDSGFITPEFPDLMINTTEFVLWEYPIYDDGNVIHMNQTPFIALPIQSIATSGQYLYSNGTSASWQALQIPDGLPIQSVATSGQYLYSNGTSASWRVNVALGAITESGLTISTDKRLLGRDNSTSGAQAVEEIELDSTLTLNGSNVLGVSTTNNPIGKHAIWIPAMAMSPRTTAGCTYGQTETATNKLMLNTLNFAYDSTQYAQFQLQMPKSWNESTVTARFVWSHPSTTTNFGVAWFIQGVAISNDDPLDAAFGTAIEVDDTGGTTDYQYVSDESGAVTIAGTPAAEDIVIFQIYRQYDDSFDTMAAVARLQGIMLYITTDAATDA